MIQIAERLMENFRNVKSHLQLLVNPLLAKNKSLGIQAVRNDQGNVIEGAFHCGVRCHWVCSILVTVEMGAVK